MTKIKKLLLNFIILASLGVSPVKAFSPQEINKFGIHLGDTSQVSMAAELVNSQGGDWGRVTIVIRDDQLNYQQWQTFFNQCRRKHLVPLVRLATHFNSQKGAWEKPSLLTLKKQATFLSQLNWPTKTKYIIVFNEPNHGKEWGGEVNPQEYGEIFLAASKIFKQKDKNFFLLFAGADQVAPHRPPSYSSPQKFYRQALANPEVLASIEGLASHSYPNHGFAGKPSDKGWGTIVGYREEIKLLKRLGLKKEIPVFITETGWPHREGEKEQRSFYPAQRLNNFFEQAFNIWNTDKKIYSFTPFILYFPHGKFSNFSWVDAEKTPYSFYKITQQIPKKSWWPEQENGGEIEKINLPLFIVPNSPYTAILEIKNTGQQIWGEKGEFCWLPEETKEVKITPLCLFSSNKVEPGDKGKFRFSFKILTPSQQTVTLEWKNLETITLKPIITSSDFVLYRPKTNFFQRLKKFFVSLWKSFDFGKDITK